MVHSHLRFSIPASFFSGETEIPCKAREGLKNCTHIKDADRPTSRITSSCVWTLRRTNTTIKAERLDVETFGSSISTLTSEIFGLEVTDSGFHKLMHDAVFRCMDNDFSDIVDQYDGQLGSEALAIIRALIAVRMNRGSIT